jgi:PPOX class probable FMN-dependent enzyme
MMVIAPTRRYVSSRDELRDIITAPEPDGLVMRKQLPALDQHAQRFIALSPFVLLSTSSAAGRCDVTPRGDGAGFVAVLDEHTLVIPERPGNRRIDSLQNIIENPHAGLLFMIPGFDETLRVNGTARVLDDPELLATMAVQGKTPRLGVEVAVEEVFFHCARAFKRSKLWATETWGERSALPSLAQIFADQMQGPGLDCESLEARLAHSSANLY